MKKLRILVLAVLAIGFYSCDQEDAPLNGIYDNSGQTGVGFRASSASVVVPVEGASVTIPVQATTLSTSERSYGVSANEELSIGMSSDYTIGSISIPANSYDGSLTVSFVDTNLVDLITNELVVDLDLPAGVATVGSKSVTIAYVKYLICNDLTLVLDEDNYADERDWNITDSTGAIVLQCSDYADCPGGQASGSVAPAQYTYTFNLPDGCYSFNIADSFEDGQYDGTITGGYSLTCSIITHASGSGNWGASQSTNFCVNP